MHLLRLAARQFGGGIHASRCLSCGLVAPLSGTFSSGTQSLHGVMARCNGSVSPRHLRGLGDHIEICHVDLVGISTSVKARTQDRASVRHS